METPVFNSANEKVGAVDLSDSIFAVPVNEVLLWETVRMQLANRRQGNHAVKNRALVRGGGRKLWRQKGTGRARVGSRRSPLWKGGGIIFGPSPRDYGYSMPKKKKKAALRAALASKARDGELIVVDSFQLTEIKTKTLAQALEKLQARNALIVLAERDDVVEKSARNIPSVKTLRVEGLNVYDVLKYDKLVLLRGAIEKLEERL